MLRIITCQKCGVTHPLPITITWKSKDEFCEKCHQCIQEVHEYSFCSHKCAIEWFKEFKNCMKGDHKWDTVYKTHEKCSICGLERYIKK